MREKLVVGNRKRQQFLDIVRAAVGEVQAGRN